MNRYLLSSIRITGVLIVILALLWLFVTRPVFPSKSPRQNAALSVNADLLKKHVTILSEELTPRNHEHYENLNQVAEYISASFRSAQATVEEQVFDIDGIPYKNVIAEFGPESEAIIVVGAHYDTAGKQPGADDNASGVAGLLELGRLLSQESLESRVVLVAFTLEEPPFFATDLMGSAVFAKSLAEQGTQVRLMISLEMIGYFTDAPESQKFPSPLLKLFYPSTGDFIAIVDQILSTQARRMKQWMNQESGVPVYSINAPSSIPGVDFSDHRNFWRHGYPAVMVTDTAFYRNRNYHKATDTAETLNYDKMAQVVDGVFSYLLHLSDE